MPSPRSRKLGGFFVIAAAEILFQEDVHADEKVAAAHFLDFQFGFAAAAIAPGNGDDGPGIATHDGLQG